MNSFTFDVGSNLTGLGYTFLFLKYLLPVAGIVLLIIGGYLAFKHFTKPVSPFDPIGRRDPSKSYLVIFIAIVLLLVAISIR